MNKTKQTNLEGKDISDVKPFVKWAGGKRKLVKKFSHLVPNSYETYFEPFVGGGAVFFYLNPKKATLNDLNDELINVYRVIKNKPDDLMKELDKLQPNVNSKDFYYELRSTEVKNRAKKAARTIYLNKTGFNGMYRVNSKGKFNIPFGDMKNVKLYSEENILSCSEYLQRADLISGDYSKLIEKIGCEDFVYLDPPYVPISDTAHFTSYTKDKFGVKEQEKLAEFCKKIDEKGGYFLLSNSDTAFCRDLYSNYNITTIKASRSIAAKGASRKAVSEVIVSNY